PSTWTEAPGSGAQAVSGTNGSLAPLLTFPACRHTSAGPSRAGRLPGSIRPWPSVGSTMARSRPRPTRPSALRTVVWTWPPTTTVTGGAPTRPWPAASQPCLVSTASLAAARQVALAIEAPVTKPPPTAAGRPSSSATQRSATAFSVAATGDITVRATFWSHATDSQAAAWAIGSAPPVTNPKYLGPALATVAGAPDSTRRASTAPASPPAPGSGQSSPRSEATAPASRAT